MRQLADNFLFIAGQFRWQDAVDIVLVWFIVYRILVLIRATGTLQMLSGMGVLALAFLSSLWLELFTLNWILERFFSNLFLIVVILFQGEIRRALAHIGSNPLFFNSSVRQDRVVVEELAKGALELAQAGLGGLIVIEREIDLEYFLELGTAVDAEVSSELLLAIFESASPLHDGAVVIRGGRIAMANWTPEGFAGQMFKLSTKYIPPPDMPAPVQWGVPEIVQQRFGDGVSDLKTEKRLADMVFEFGPEEVAEFFKTYFGPTVMALKAMGEENHASYTKDLSDTWAANNTANDGTTHVKGEFLEVIATKA